LSSKTRWSLGNRHRTSSGHHWVPGESWWRFRGVPSYKAACRGRTRLFE